MNKFYSGVAVPMVTPLTQDLKIDEESLNRIVTHLTQGGCFPFVLGTTGESASLSSQQKTQVVRASVRSAGGSPVFAGVSSNCLGESIDAAQEYFDLGVQAVIAHPPCYYPLTPEELFSFYQALSKESKGPVIMYNIPLTTHISIPLEVIERLSHLPNIVGLKDSENSEQRLEKALEWCTSLDRFSYFMGVGALAGKSLLSGADGLVPSTGNLVPQLYRDMMDKGRQKDLAGVNDLQERTLALSRIYQQGRNLGQSLAALKALMEIQGLCQSHMMPPLTSLNEEEKILLRETFSLDTCA